MRATTAPGRRLIKLYDSKNENYQILCISLSAKHTKSNELHGVSTEIRRDKSNKLLGYLPSRLVAEPDRIGGRRRQIPYGEANAVYPTCQTLRNQFPNSAQNTLKQLIKGQVEVGKQAEIRRTDSLVTPQDHQMEPYRNHKRTQINQIKKVSVTALGGMRGWRPKVGLP